MPGEIFLSDIMIDPDFKMVVALLGGISFNIGFLFIVFFIFKRKFTSYQKSAVRHKSFAVSVKELNYTNKNRVSQEAPDLLFYKASHDLKGPLKAIRGLVQLAMKDNNKENQRLYLEKINESTTSLEDFINEILSLGRIKREGKVEKLIDLGDFLENIVEGFEAYPGRDKIEIDIKIGADVEVVSDDSLLKSISQNLIENAIKYCDERKPFSELVITVEKYDDHYSIVFSDNGIGIEEENLPHIFDLFYRANSLKDGSGLGLFIVKEALKKLNGKIKVTSRRNVGSEFGIEIPIKKSSHPKSTRKKIRAAVER